MIPCNSALVFLALAVSIPNLALGQGGCNPPQPCGNVQQGGYNQAQQWPAVQPGAYASQQNFPAVQPGAYGQQQWQPQPGGYQQGQRQCGQAGFNQQGCPNRFGFIGNNACQQARRGYGSSSCGPVVTPAPGGPCQSSTKPGKQFIGWVYKTDTAPTLDACIAKCCAEQPRCRSAHWFSDTNECYLKESSAVERPDLLVDSKEPAITYIQITSASG